MSDKGSDNGAGAGGAVGGGPSFTERELQLLSFAMRSLKSGPPEIDYEKLAAFAGMSNPRSASNAWAKIKNKLMSPGEDSVATPKSPAKATPKKKATSKVKSEPVVDGEDGEAGADTANPSPKKAATPRKRAQKKQDVDGETSPKKKGRPAKGKKATENESAAAENAEDKAESNGDGQINGGEAAPAAPAATAETADGMDEAFAEI